ncbi:hypothetical protein Q1695_004303 [Nippostrongylus brasiliensis]|nr:hypothetical protein Q1695_004303 [Nippostrongylus brasiliensis]
MPARVQSMCPDCGKVFLKKNLWPHLAFVHRHTKQEVLRIREQINTEMGVNKVTCPLCEENLFATFKDLAQHCQQTHAENGAGGLPQDYSVFSLKFDNEQQYTVWLEEKCVETCSSLSVARTVIKQGSKIRSLHCNRGGSGKRCSVATIRKTTSKKVVLHCSCYLLAAFNDDGTVDVEGCFGHVGHNVDPALIRRTKSQKILLAQIRQEKRQQVIDEIKRTYAVLEAKVTSLGKVDTHEALLELKQALAHLQLAVEAVHGPETASPVAQLEIMRIKAKRKLSEVPLCQRGKLKKMKRMSKENEMITNDDHDKEQEDADH